MLPLWRPVVVTLLAASVAVPSVASAAPVPSPVSTAPAMPTSTPRPVPLADPLAGLTLAQEVGQLFMVGTSAKKADPVTLAAISRLHVGNVFLSGRSHAGRAATKQLAATLQARATASATRRIPLLVATDQEGGEVQVLQGPGFATMPSALRQSALGTARLKADAASWGRQLRAAGVAMDLAPVADEVTSAASARRNPPVGGFDREYGYGPASASAGSRAFAAGLKAAGVVATAKHFPGLGHVTHNTDTTRGVTDRVTTSAAVKVGPFADAVAAGIPVVMVSNAIYARIDPSQPALFSKRIVTTLLRDRLGFDGVVITDDVSKARAVTGYTAAERAVWSIEAGCDLVLVSAEPRVAAPMVKAVVAKAQRDPSFRAQVDAAARRVLALKATQR